MKYFLNNIPVPEMANPAEPAQITTKEKILEAALSLYNAHGIKKITIRHIAAEIDISHGNLRYHFPTTKDIIRTLFGRMGHELNVPLSKFGTQGKEISPEAIYGNVQAIYSIMERYRFIFLDFTSIVRMDKNVRNAFRKVMEKRKEQLTFFFRAMRDADFMRKDISENFYRRLTKAILMLGYAWLPNRALYEETLKEGLAPQYANIIFSLFIPYLTEKGMAKFKDVLVNLDTPE